MCGRYTLTRHDVVAEELQAFAAGSAFPRLQSIDLGNHRDDMDYGIPGVLSLAQAPFAKTLRSITMTNRWLDDELVDAIALFPALVDLDLTNNSLTDDGARALLDLPNVWTSLALGGNGIGESTQAALTARLGERVRFTR